jgi:hypothetical protein
MTTHNQYIRKASLVLGNSTDGIDLSAMQFSFETKQADIEFPQTCSIRIYNLSSDTTKKIKTDAYTRVILSAGYDSGAFGVIFDGEIVQARLGRESAVDTFMDILAAEGYSNHQATINQTIAAGSSVVDAGNAAASAMGTSLNTNGYNPNFKLPRGQALYGMARDALHKAAATAGCSYFYANGAVQMVPLQGYRTGDAVVLNANTGMIGWPEQTQEGIKIQCLLNPLIDVGSRVKIDNASILRAQVSTSITFVNTLPQVDDDGLYRVYVIEHKGNTRGNEWYSNIVALSINPDKAGLTPLIQKGQF